MSITRGDVKAACFVTDLKEAEELALNNKGLVDLGCISEASNLTSLNLAFNSLVSVAALSTLTGLTSLNISHNALAVCSKNLSALTALTHLNASHNKIVSISGLTACCGLQELWLQHNQLSAAELEPLAALPSLARLVISPNPLVRQTPPDQLRATLAAMCPQLKVLDGLPITDSEREAGRDMPARSWGRSNSLGTSWRTSLGTVVTPQRQQTSAPSSAGQVGVLLGLTPPRTHGVGRAGRRAAGQAPLPPRPAPGVLSTDPGSAGTWMSDAADTLPDRDTISDTSSVSGLSWLQDETSSSRKARSRRDAGVPKIKHLPPTSAFQSVLSGLPELASKLPPDYSPTKLAAGRTRKALPAQPPADATTTAYELRYPGGSRGRAVRACKDGSLCATWPNGDIAVTVDADHSQQPPTYRMLALYRQTGNVAVSWDSTGGFVQYPNGALCLVWSAGTGAGTLFNPSGGVLLKWNDDSSTAGQDVPPSREHEEGPTLQGEAEGGISVSDYNDALSSSSAVESQAHCNGRSKEKRSTSATKQVSNGWSPLKPCPPVDMALDMHMGVRFLRHRQELEVWLACDGVQYRVVCARNEPEALWHVGQLAGQGCCAPPAFLKQLSSGRGAGEVRQTMMRQAAGSAVSEQSQAAAIPGQDTFASVLAGLEALSSKLQ